MPFVIEGKVSGLADGGLLVVGGIGVPPGATIGTSGSNGSITVLPVGDIARPAALLRWSDGGWSEETFGSAVPNDVFAVRDEAHDRVLIEGGTPGWTWEWKNGVLRSLGQGPDLQRKTIFETGDLVGSRSGAVFARNDAVFTSVWAESPAPGAVAVNPLTGDLLAVGTATLAQLRNNAWDSAAMPRISLPSGFAINRTVTNPASGEVLVVSTLPGAPPADFSILDFRSAQPVQAWRFDVKKLIGSNTVRWVGIEAVAGASASVSGTQWSLRTLASWQPISAPSSASAEAPEPTSAQLDVGSEVGRLVFAASPVTLGLSARGTSSAAPAHLVSKAVQLKVRYRRTP
jgi:hypothetical protein